MPERQKSCTLIVIWVKCLYLTSPTFNSSAKSNRLFFIAKEEVYITINWTSALVWAILFPCLRDWRHSFKHSLSIYSRESNRTFSEDNGISFTYIEFTWKIGLCYILLYKKFCNFFVAFTFLNCTIESWNNLKSRGVQVSCQGREEYICQRMSNNHVMTILENGSTTAPFSPISHGSASYIILETFASKKLCVFPQLLDPI